MKKKSFIIISSLVACLIMYFVETYIKPGFVIKSIIKLIVFLTTIYTFKISFDKDFKIFNKIDKGKLKNLLCLGALVYFGLLLGYFILKDYIDLDKIRESLLSKEGVTKDNFIYVAIYISIVNSFLEELFFRGFVFRGLVDLGEKKTGYAVSSGAFAIYHIAIMGSWFSPWMLALLIGGLFITGIFFDYLTERFGSFLAPWMVHGMANLSINTVGLIMLGII